MKTISDYSIYCTEAQTKKALEIGALIKLFCKDFKGKTISKGYCLINKDLYYIPTAEQLIGWLEEQEINIVIGRFFAKWAFKLEQIDSQGEENLHIDSINISSRKEAILAAIDAALEYLSNKK